jgi:hypothetical protein
MVGFLAVEVSYCAKRKQGFSKKSYTLAKLSGLQNSLVSD